MKHRDGLTNATLEKEKDKWNIYIENQRKEYLSKNLIFEFPRVHIMTHFTDNVDEFGALHQRWWEI